MVDVATGAAGKSGEQVEFLILLSITRILRQIKYIFLFYIAPFHVVFATDAIIFNFNLPFPSFPKFYSSILICFIFFKIPLLFLVPRLDLFDSCLATSPSMLGFGDILIPGMLLAYVYRFERISKCSGPYFLVGFIGIHDPAASPIPNLQL